MKTLYQLSLLFVLASSCTNGGLSSLRSTSNSAGATGGTGTVASNGITLTQVIKSNLDPYNQIDLIGNADGAIGSTCSQAPASPTTPQCQCVFTYDSVSNGGTELKTTNSSYVEQNLLRCSYSAATIPTDATNLSVKILHVSSSSESNAISFSLNGSGTGIFNLSDASNYSEVSRYLCKQNLYIQWRLATGTNKVYDPHLSHDPLLNYSFNFYTANFARSLDVFTLDANSSKWECQNDLNLAPSASYDSRVYSLLPLSGGDSTIYPKPSSPPVGYVNRYSFALPRKATGVFNVGINMYIAPNINTVSTANARNPSMIYGARPIPDDTRPGEESCSKYTTSMGITLPSGYSWVKVWLFKSTLDPREYVYSRKINTFAQTLLCDGKASNPSGTNDYASTHVCYRDGMGKYFADTDLPNASQTTNALVKRLNITPQTFLGQEDFSSTLPGIDPDGGGLLVTDQNYTRYACFLPTINPSSGITSDISAGKANSLQVHPNTDSYYLYHKSIPGKVERIKSLGLDADENYGIPTADDVENVLIDNGNNYDFLFVVSPDTVHSKEFDMSGGSSGSSIAQQYTPIRFKSSSVCNPYVVGCENSELDKVIRYQVTRFDVSENIDPGQTTRGPIFPICAIQKN